MITTYQVFSKNIHFEGEFITQYGIVCKKNNLQIEDITCEQEVAQRLVRVLNDQEIEPIHFKDIIEDFLCDQSDEIFQ